MLMKDRRPAHLGWIEVALQVTNQDLPDLRISAQSHYGSYDRLAFIDVIGVDDDRQRRRQIRAEAGDMMGRLGYAVGIECGRDVYDLTPLRATSAHERMRMLQCLRAACKQK